MNNSSILAFQAHKFPPIVEGASFSELYISADRHAAVFYASYTLERLIDYICKMVNTLVHADYSERASVLVVKAPGFFGFRNPGHMRVPIETALRGGTSDCRNRNLQIMFSLIGLGEQAGSGIPRVLQNWKVQHYRLPELWEIETPAATLMRLRTVSLLPEDTLVKLLHQFGEAFEQLDEHGRVALVTAEIEGYLTNSRMQQLCDVHPSDITVLLKALVDKGLLMVDGQGRATSYRVAQAAVTELTDVINFEDPVSGAASSGHKSASSGHKSTRSSHKDASSGHTGLIGLTDKDWKCLIVKAKPVSESRRSSPEIVRETIVSLCARHYLSMAQIAELLNRDQDAIRRRYVTPMVNEGLLERRFPKQPNHEQQTYVASASESGSESSDGS